MVGTMVVLLAHTYVSLLQTGLPLTRTKEGTDMLKRLNVALAALVLGVVAIVVPASSAGGGKAIMISERMQLTGPDTQAGSWVGAGEISDAGSATASFTLVPKGNYGKLTGTHELNGSAGTITIETTARVRPFPPEERAMVEGRWRIIGGTGAYARLHGQGKVYATGDFTTGDITIVRDGTVREGCRWAGPPHSC